VSVLVVEDEALIRLDFASELETEGFEVFEAANADQAIVLLVAEPSIRVMFTDIDMPGSMDGLKLAAAVHDRWPPVKIIVQGRPGNSLPVAMWLIAFMTLAPPSKATRNRLTGLPAR